MVPIEKNILVVDEQGNEYEATWPKRARGLVKNGRARFLSENKICLACPPEIDMEDNEMTDTILTDVIIKDIVTANAPAEENEAFGEPGMAAETETTSVAGDEENGGSPKSAKGQNRTESVFPGQIDVAYIFNQIRAIQEQTEYLNEAIRSLSLMSDGDSGDCGAPGNIMGVAKAQAIGDVVRCRETTNQQLLTFYISVYNDLKSQA